jgi:hypothetical protein
MTTQDDLVVPGRVLAEGGGGVSEPARRWDFEANRKRMQEASDREFRRIKRVIYVGWTVGLVALAVALWAVIRLVLHFT